MPIYEFTCHTCGTNFEKRVSFTQTQAPPCDTCESPNVQRRLSAPAIHFKGKGWYVTDSKKSNSANGSSSVSKSESSSESSTAAAEPVAA